MPASRTKMLALGSGLMLLAAVVPGLRFRGEPKVLYRLGGVELERVDRALLPQDERVDADNGDLLIANGSIVLTIGASTASAARRANHGVILDVADRNFRDDGMDSFRVGLQLAGKSARLRTQRVEALRDANVPFIRVSAQDPDSGVVLTTDVRLSRNKNTVEIVTELSNRGAQELVARVGDEVAWPGVPTFAPAVGEVEASGRKSVPWLARRGAITYGLVFPQGEAEVEFRAHRSETDQTCWSAPLPLAPGASASYRRLLVVT
ncbi:MAG TPA: hypothetical protein VFV94_16470, partial [Polyangiaceae bacterium]|nr:hypothetical protein [Polyangiaceae bacterium]